MAHILDHDDSNTPSGLIAPITPTQTSNTSSHTNANPPFTPRSTTFPDHDSDSEYGDSRQVHTPRSSQDQAPHYEDLPPTYEEAQQAAFSEHEAVLSRSPGHDTRARAQQELNRSHRTFSIHRMVLSDEHLPIPVDASTQSSSQARDNASRDVINVEDFTGEPAIDLPRYSSIAGDFQYPPSSQTIDVRRQRLLEQALDFTRAQPNLDPNNPPQLSRKIAIPPATGVNRPTQFLRACSKALLAHGISPDEFAAFIDGLNAICHVERFSSSTAALFDSSDNLLASYLAGANEAFFAPRGIKIRLTDLRSLLSALGLPDSRERISQILLSVKSFDSDPRKKAEVLMPYAEPLSFDIPEPNSRSMALKTLAEQLSPEQTSAPSELPVGAESRPAYAEDRLSDPQQTPSRSHPIEQSHAGPSQAANQSWAEWGVRMGKLGEDFGKSMGRWGEDLSQEMARRGEAWGRTGRIVGQNAEEWSRRIGEESRRFNIPGLGPHAPVGAPFPGRGAYSGAQHGGARNGQTADPGNNVPGVGAGVYTPQPPSFPLTGHGARSGPFRGGPFGAGPFGGYGPFGSRGGLGGFGRPGHFGCGPGGSHSGPGGFSAGRWGGRGASRGGPWVRGRRSRHHNHHGSDEENDDEISLSSDSDSEESEESDSDSDSDYEESKKEYLKRVDSINKRANDALSKAKKPVVEIEAERTHALAKTEEDRNKFEKKHQKRKARRSVKHEVRTLRKEMRREHRVSMRDKKRAFFVARRNAAGAGKYRDRKEGKRAWRDERKKHKDEWKAKKKELKAWKKDWTKQMDQEVEEGRVEDFQDRGLGGGSVATGVVGREVDVSEEIWIVVENLGD